MIVIYDEYKQMDMNCGSYEKLFYGTLCNHNKNGTAIRVDVWWTSILQMLCKFDRIEGRPMLPHIWPRYKSPLTTITCLSAHVLAIDIV